MVDPFFRTATTARTDARVNYDAGLRVHMQRIFSYMAGGLALTGFFAFLVANTAALANLIFGTPLQYVVMLAPLGFMMFLNAKIHSIKSSTAQMVFWSFCSIMGLSLGAIFMTYTAESVARAFFITSATFAGMSIWGYTTRRNLADFGAFLVMGIMGILIASVINIFMQSSMMQWVVSVASVAVFTGLTAFDVQRIKGAYSEANGHEANSKMAVMGALSLYMNFLNAFLALLRLMGDRR